MVTSADIHSLEVGHTLRISSLHPQQRPPAFYTRTKPSSPQTILGGNSRGGSSNQVVRYLPPPHDLLVNAITASIGSPYRNLCYYILTVYTITGREIRTRSVHRLTTERGVC